MILETIAEATRKRVAAEKEKCSLAEMKEKAMAMNPDTGFPFEQALKKAGHVLYLRGKKSLPRRRASSQKISPIWRSQRNMKRPVPPPFPA